ncbi:hypothetical protein ABK040_003309 [Willaertia magna]
MNPNEVFYSFSYLNGATIRSKWNQEKKKSVEHGMQTEEIEYTDLNIQTDFSCINNDFSVEREVRQNQEIQTETLREVYKRVKEEKGNQLTMDSKKILSFLQTVTPLMEKELDNAGTVHKIAFMDYDVNWSVDIEEMVVVHELKLPNRITKNFTEPLAVTDLSWNCKGNIIGVSFGRLNHNGWCLEPGYICFYYINSDIYTDFKLEQKILIENEECYVMKVSFHPTKHNIIVSGTYDGVIKVYKLHQDTDTLICQSPIESYSHRDPITSLQWVKNRYDDSYLILSMSGEGKLLLWSLNNKLEVPIYAISLTYAGVNRKTSIGGSCLSFLNIYAGSAVSQKNVATTDSSFVVGTEVGKIFRMGISDAKLINSRKLLQSTTTTNTTSMKKNNVIFKEEKYEFSYENGTGYVYTVDTNPFNKELFMSCSSDGLVRIYNIFRSKDSLTLQPSSETSMSAKFSPFRPLVVAVANSNGHLYMYDLQQSMTEPVADIDASGDSKQLTCVEFNKFDSTLMATGDIIGRVKIFQVSNRLSQLQNQEILRCNQLFSLHSLN